MFLKILEPCDFSRGRFSLNKVDDTYKSYYVFLDEILYQSFNGTGLKIVAIFPFPRYQV